MYRPNFCSDCGTKIIRLRWYPWTSGRFCASCSQRLKKERLTLPLVAGIVLFGIGLAAGRAARFPTPPLIIERNAIPSRTSSVSSQDASASNGGPGSASSNVTVSAHPGSQTQQTSSAGVVYICGARTKKGKPCSRRFPEAVRCWQHKGMPAMLPPEKLIVKVD